MPKKAMKDQKEIATFEVASDLLDRLRAVAKLEDITMSQIFRRGLSLYVTRRLKSKDASPEVKAILMGKPRK
jgi:predicted transcriptional regulator